MTVLIRALQPHDHERDVSESRPLTQGNMPPHIAFVLRLALVGVIAWLVSAQLVLSRVQRAHPQLYEDESLTVLMF